MLLLDERVTREGYHLCVGGLPARVSYARRRPIVR